MLKIEQFVKEQFGIELTRYQLELIAIIAANPDEPKTFMMAGKQTGKTTAVKSAIAYLQDGLTDITDQKADSMLGWLEKQHPLEVMKFFAIIVYKYAMQETNATEFKTTVENLSHKGTVIGNVKISVQLVGKGDE